MQGARMVCACSIELWFTLDRVPEGSVIDILFPLTVQSYIDMAQKDKERYVREYMAYQDTDSYKEFMRKKYPGLAKKRKVEHKAETPPQQTPKEKVHASYM